MYPSCTGLVPGGLMQEICAQETSIYRTTFFYVFLKMARIYTRSNHGLFNAHHDVFRIYNTYPHASSE